MARGGTELRDALTNEPVGVFVGVEASGLAPEDAGVFSTSGGALSITSGRLSYTLGLVGPCYSIDTACASALAALHVCACAVGVGGECDEGVGMGTKVLSEASNVATSAGGMTSPHGRCHTFDRRADGYCRGEGCGAFLVWSHAEWSGRSAARSAVSVLGSAVQQDGPSASLTAPNGSAQRVHPFRRRPLGSCIKEDPAHQFSSRRAPAPGVRQREPFAAQPLERQCRGASTKGCQRDLWRRHLVL